MTFSPQPLGVMFILSYPVHQTDRIDDVRLAVYPSSGRELGPPTKISISDLYDRIYTSRGIVSSYTHTHTLGSF